MQSAADRSSLRRVKPPRWEYLILGFILLLLVMLGIAGYVVAERLKEPVRVSDRFVYALLSEDRETAYELTAEPFRQATNYDQFREISGRFNQTVKTKPKLDVHRIERTPNDVLLATVEYNIPGTVDNRLIVKLIKEKDTWRVLNINTSPALIR